MKKKRKKKSSTAATRGALHSWQGVLRNAALLSRLVFRKLPKRGRHSVFPPVVGHSNPAPVIDPFSRSLSLSLARRPPGCSLYCRTSCLFYTRHCRGTFRPCRCYCVCWCGSSTFPKADVWARLLHAGDAGTMR